MVMMIAILIVFLLGTYWWMNRKPANAYSPTREDVLILLRKVVGGMNTELEWDTFIGVPIEKDEKLEGIRKKCESIDDNLEYSKGSNEGFMFNEKGLMEIKTFVTQLESYIKTEGRQKTDFQINCSQILDHKLQQLGMKFTSWAFVDGDEESYYLGELKGVQVFVYEDGASIKSEQGSYMFESQDYKTESELTRALVGKLTELVTR